MNIDWKSFFIGIASYFVFTMLMSRMMAGGSGKKS